MGHVQRYVKRKHYYGRNVETLCRCPEGSCDRCSDPEMRRNVCVGEAERAKDSYGRSPMISVLSRCGSQTDDVSHAIELV